MLSDRSRRGGGITSQQLRTTTLLQRAANGYLEPARAGRQSIEREEVESQSPSPSARRRIIQQSPPLRQHTIQQSPPHQQHIIQQSPPLQQHTIQQSPPLQQHTIQQSPPARQHISEQPRQQTTHHDKEQSRAAFVHSPVPETIAIPPADGSDRVTAVLSADEWQLIVAHRRQCTATSSADFVFVAGNNDSDDELAGTRMYSQSILANILSQSSALLPGDASGADATATATPAAVDQTAQTTDRSADDEDDSDDAGSARDALINLDEITQRIFCASLLVQNALQILDPAMLGELARVSFDGLEAKMIDRYLLSQKLWYRTLIFGTIACHLLLSFFEPTSTTSTTVLPLALTQLLPMLFACIYLVDTAIRASYLTRDDLLSGWNVVKLLLIGLTFAEGLSYIGLLLADRPPWSFWLLLRAVRPFFLIERASSLRTIVASTCRASAAVVPIFGITASVLFLYSYLGFIVFTGLPEGRAYFGTLADSLTNMFVLLTTANFPDVMLPVYAQQPWSALFFVSYLIVILFFLVHLVTATFYNTFRSHTAALTRDQLALRSDCLSTAFHLLDYHNTGALPFTQWCELLVAMDLGWSEHEMDLCFHLVDGDASGSICLQEFQQAFLIFACVLLAVETTGCSPAYSNEQNEEWHCEVWAGVALLVSALFMVEQLLHTFALGWRRFLKSRWRLVDFVLCASMFATQIVCATLDFVSPQTSAYLLIPRVFVILRLFINFRMTRRILRALRRILDPIGRYLLVLFCFYFVFAVCGVYFFAGLVQPGDPRLQNTPYALAGFWPNNFDSLHSAFVVLFEVMVINNFPLTMEAYALVTSSWTRLYFVVFIVLSVYIFLNMFTGFILESFLRAYQAVDARVAFARSLQHRVDRAAAHVRQKHRHNDADQLRWHAEFNDSLLDFYLDLFNFNAVADPFNEL